MFKTLATTHVSFLGWNLGHAKGAPNSTGVGGGVGPKAKGKGRRNVTNGDASTFARVLPVPNERMQMSSRLILDVSSLSPILIIIQVCACPRS